MALQLSAFDLDFGGSLQSVSALTYNTELDFNQSGKGIGWFLFDIEPIKLYLQGSYSLDYANSSQELTFYPEFDTGYLESQFSLEGSGLESIGLILGRFDFADPTGLVLNQTLDGLYLGGGSGGFSFNVYGGYNGFIYKGSSNMILTAADTRDKDNDENYFASPRLVAGGEVSWRFPGNQVLKIHALAQQDMREAWIEGADITAVGETSPDATNSGLLSNQYGIMEFTGLLGSDFSYEVFGALELGQSFLFNVTDSISNPIVGAYEYRTILAGMGGLGFTYFMQDFLGSFIQFRAIGSTGEDNRDSYGEGSEIYFDQDITTLFKPLTTASFGRVFNPQLGNIAIAELTYSMRPFATSLVESLRNIQISLKGMTFFRIWEGPISNPDLVSASTERYLGSEIDLTVGFRPFSDLGVFFTTGAFLPAVYSGGAFEGTRETVEITASAFVSFSF